MPDRELRRVAEAKIANLYSVLTAARTMGVAIGILMVRQKLSEYEAYETLICVSERSGRMVREIAADVVQTGELPEA